MNRLLLAAALVVLLAIVGCGSGDLTLDQADPEAVAPVPTWDQVFGIFQRECVPCHTGDDGGDGPEDRSTRGYGSRAPSGGAEPGLETCASILDNFRACYERIFESNDMPPGAWPRLSSEEKLIIQRWRDAGGDAPCQ